MQGSLETANHAVDLLSGGIGSSRSGKVGVSFLEILDDLPRVLLRLVRGVGVGDVGLRGREYQSSPAGRSRPLCTPCGRR